MMYGYIEMERERERKWESCEPFLFFLGELNTSL